MAIEQSVFLENGNRLMAFSRSETIVRTTPRTKESDFFVVEPSTKQLTEPKRLSVASLDLSATMQEMKSNRWVILIVSLIVSAILSVVLIVLAAMFDGMSHSSKSMYTLFPYGTSVVMRTPWSSIGMILLVIQFPLYALILNLVRPLRWKAVALVLIIAIHVLAVVLGVRAYGTPIL